MGCGSRPWARAKPLAARYITHSKFNRAPFIEAEKTGAFYVLERIESSLRHYRDSSIRVEPGNPLDVI
jgi:hypothetical protein